MRLVSALALVAGMLMLAGSGLYSQEKKDNPAPKLKGQLPSGWAKLELTQEQKVAIYKVQAKYKEDIAKLKEKIRETETEEKQEMVKVLTPEQKKKLQEMATGESTKDAKKE